MINCIRCVDGTYQPNVNVTRANGCVGCPKGNIDADLDPVTACTQCLRGRYQNEIGTYSGECAYGTNATICT